uniref:CAAX prenyl protease 2/Lysostaphin resistance protein A-like domain-containing protein n=1 Tax=mine drainage metagenome TaxID=410659 RepID=E6Q4X0_9ZZZZ
MPNEHPSIKADQLQFTGKEGSEARAEKLAKSGALPSDINQSFLSLIKITRLTSLILWSFIALILISFMSGAVIALLYFQKEISKQTVTLLMGLPFDALTSYAVFGVIMLGGLLLALWRTRLEKTTQKSLREVLFGNLTCYRAVIVGLATAVFILSPEILHVFWAIASRKTIPLVAQHSGVSFGTSPMGIVLILVIPLLEEIFFRLWLQSVLQKYIGIWGAAVACLLFIAAHMSAWILVIPSAVALTWIRYKHGSLISTLTMHITNNALVTLFFILAGKRL